MFVRISGSGLLSRWHCILRCTIATGDPEVDDDDEHDVNRRMARCHHSGSVMMIINWTVDCTFSILL